MRDVRHALKALYLTCAQRDSGHTHGLEVVAMSYEKKSEELRQCSYEEQVGTEERAGARSDLTKSKSCPDQVRRFPLITHVGRVQMPTLTSCYCDTLQQNPERAPLSRALLLHSTDTTLAVC